MFRWEGIQRTKQENLNWRGFRRTEQEMLDGRGYRRTEQEILDGRGYAEELKKKDQMGGDTEELMGGVTEELNVQEGNQIKMVEDTEDVNKSCQIRYRYLNIDMGESGFRKFTCV